MTHRDRAGDPSGHWAGRREAAGPAGHRQGFPTPPQIRPLPARLRDRNGGFRRLSDGPWLSDGTHGYRCPASPRHALLAESLNLEAWGKPSLWVIINAPWYKCGVPITDIASGILAATGILAALHRRQTTGEGDHVPTSLLEAGVMFTFLQSAIALASGTIPIPLGSAHPLYAPYEVLQASGGWIALGTANEANWLRLVEVIGRPELARDPQFSTTSARVENRKELKTALSQCFAGAPRDTWVERLAEVGVPCGPVLTVPQMLEHSQVQSCRMVVSVHHREFGDSRAIGCPLKFSRAGTALPKPAPLLNEN